MIILDRGKVVSQSPGETLSLGEATGRVLCSGRQGGIVALVGELGSGKTCFAKGVARAVAVDPVQVVSPTFIIQNRLVGRCPFNHFDAYRLHSAAEFEDLGADDFLYEKGAVTLIEWADKIEGALPADLLRIRFFHAGEGERELHFEWAGEAYGAVFAKLWKKIGGEV